jgi:hypothetical protein
VLTKVISECSNPESKYIGKPEPKDADCQNFFKGRFAGCVYHGVGYMCPTPEDSEECRGIRTYTDCMIKTHREPSDGSESQNEEKTEKKIMSKVLHAQV